jgi:hypothetical protein
VHAQRLRPRYGKGSSAFLRWHSEAVAGGADFEPGTYELIGPKVNGNPEGWDNHALIRHGSVVVGSPGPVTFEGVRDILTSEFRFEGIVWHHPDGRTAKLKKRDFPT